MKKLFRLFILTAMAVAFVAPFTKSQTVEAADTFSATDIKVGGIVHFTENVVADPNYVFYDSKVSTGKDGIKVVSDDPKIAEIKNVKITDGGKKQFTLQDKGNEGKTGTFESVNVSFDVVGKAKGDSFIRIFNGDHVAMGVTLASVSDSDPATKGSMNRLYNPNSGEHFYTSSDKEKNHLVNLGWRYEGIGWKAPAEGTPVYRFYNANGGEHHYTSSEKERDALMRAGWTYEGIGWYSDPNQGVTVYRVYNPNAFANNHHYTTSKKERDTLVSLGWKNEGIAWYGVK